MKAVTVLTAKADDAVKLRLRHARLNSFVEFPGDGCRRLQKAHAEQRKRNAEAARDRKDDRGTLRLKDIHAALVPDLKKPNAPASPSSATTLRRHPHATTARDRSPP